MNWLLYDNGLRPERVKDQTISIYLALEKRFLKKTSFSELLTITADVNKSINI